MNEIGIFWICLFGYWTITATVKLLTYNKRQALIDLIRQEYGKKVSELVKEKVTDSKDELDDDEVEEIYDEVGRIQ